MLNSKEIAKNFTKAAKSYDDVACVQKQTATTLAQLVKFTPQTILDCGAGTGYSTDALLEKFKDDSNIKYMLNDLSNSMLAKCQEKFSKLGANCSYFLGDMSIIDLPKADLVISNLAIQWIEDFEQIVQKLYNCASKQLLFSTMIEGSFKNWQEIVEKYQNIRMLEFLKFSEIKQICQNLGAKKAEFFLHEFELKFSDAYDFICYLKKLGANSNWKKMDSVNLRKLLKFETKEFVVKYKILIVNLEK